MARVLTRDGVEGLRWVLLDPPEAAAADANAAAAAAVASGVRAADAAAGELSQAPHVLPTAPASLPGAAASHRADPDLRTSPRQALMLGGIKTVVVLLALGAAVATAWRVIGAPRWPGGGMRPAALPAKPAQPAASVATLTAGLQPPATPPVQPESGR